MSLRTSLTRLGLVVWGCWILSASAEGAVVQILVTVQNLAPANSVSFAPLHVGFNNGTFDAFNINTPATAPIISIAEGGSGSDWIPAFQAADPTAVLGQIGGPLLPGMSASRSFMVDTSVNRFFTFASMVIPSNDLFIGNDNPAAFEIVDAQGNLLISQINQTAAQIWDAGSEIADPANAAFVVGGNNDLRTPQNGVVTFDFSELNVFNGLTTGAGYVFNNSLAGGTDIARISFTITAVPEPSTWGMLATFGIGLAIYRNRGKLARKLRLSRN